MFKTLQLFQQCLVLIIHDWHRCYSQENHFPWVGMDTTKDETGPCSLGAKQSSIPTHLRFSIKALF